MATIKRWIDRARGKRSPSRTRRGGWFAERRDTNGYPTLLSRDLRVEEWEDESPDGTPRRGWFQPGSAALRKRKWI